MQRYIGLCRRQVYQSCLPDDEEQDLGRYPSSQNKGPCRGVLTPFLLIKHIMHQLIPSKQSPSILLIHLSSPNLPSRLHAQYGMLRDFQSVQEPKPESKRRVSYHTVVFASLPEDCPPADPGSPPLPPWNPPAEQGGTWPHIFWSSCGGPPGLAPPSPCWPCCGKFS